MDFNNIDRTAAARTARIIGYECSDVDVGSNVAAASVMAKGCEALSLLFFFST